MAKQKTAFVCSDCGSDYVKWQGQCSDCGAWNTLKEIRLGPAKGSGRAGAGVAVADQRAGFAGAKESARVLEGIDDQDEQSVKLSLLSNALSCVLPLPPCDFMMQGQCSSCRAAVNV